MEKTELTVSLETERMDALRYFLEKENTTPQKQMEEALAALYEKCVPADLREYLDSRLKPPAAARPRPRRPAHPPASHPAPPAETREDTP